MMSALTPNNLLNHWQGHRRLTRRAIEAFPEDQLFSFSVGGMRPFGEMIKEMIRLVPEMINVARGTADGKWNASDDEASLTKAELLTPWDERTEEINALWLQIPPERFLETVTAFGQWTAPVYDLILYAVDNEVHRRGQGYGYLRALSVERLLHMQQSLPVNGLSHFPAR